VDEEPHCGGCGECLVVIPNPSQEMLEASGGYEFMVREFSRFGGEDFKIEDVQLGLCTGCDSVSFLGPEVTITGTVIEE